MYYPPKPKYPDYCYLWQIKYTNTLLLKIQSRSRSKVRSRLKSKNIHILHDSLILRCHCLSKVLGFYLMISFVFPPIYISYNKSTYFIFLITLDIYIKQKHKAKHIEKQKQPYSSRSSNVSMSFVHNSLFEFKDFIEYPSFFLKLTKLLYLSYKRNNSPLLFPDFIDIVFTHI